jgi:hypothetical protein
MSPHSFDGRYARPEDELSMRPWDRPQSDLKVIYAAGPFDYRIRATGSGLILIYRKESPQTCFHITLDSNS